MFCIEIHTVLWSIAFVLAVVFVYDAQLHHVLVRDNVKAVWLLLELFVPLIRMLLYSRLYRRPFFISIAQIMHAFQDFNHLFGAGGVDSHAPPVVLVEDDAEGVLEHLDASDVGFVCGHDLQNVVLRRRAFGVCVQVVHGLIERVPRRTCWRWSCGVGVIYLTCTRFAESLPGARRPLTAPRTRPDTSGGG